MCKYVVVGCIWFSNADEVKGKTFKLIQGSLTEQKTLVKIMTACKNGMPFTGNLIKLYETA